ncbi:hypothetical protein COV18_06940 [Candidatus Woesearchaeota archaeon CG10_big_fil_rev_8_21_14_0_10_37_12]|nr:MAG: hypothetical protein COV18_06940 [Candidatus Woesearchaeota archaeon CG10_big_fil_rev_8_21_14_0_10_37_12]
MMRSVVDTNVLITFFWEKSVARQLFYNNKLSLVSPEYALEEINKYQTEVCKKAQISSKQFEQLKIELAKIIEFAPLNQYSNLLKQALNISPDSNDVDFIALAIKENCALWTNDKKLSEQNAVIVLSTEELIECLTDIEQTEKIN